MGKGELHSFLLAELYQTLAHIQEVLPEAIPAREELEGEVARAWLFR